LRHPSGAGLVRQEPDWSVKGRAVDWSQANTIGWHCLCSWGALALACASPAGAPRGETSAVQSVHETVDLLCKG
ncbi:MAG: hypothetical protein ACE5HO_06345, partial [bacterium]